MGLILLNFNSGKFHKEIEKDYRARQREREKEARKSKTKKSEDLFAPEDWEKI